MNRIPTIILVSLFSSLFIFAQDQSTNSVPKIAGIIRAKDADFFYNQTATITGKVAQVTFRPQVVFLNLDEAYPNSPFAGVIFTKDTNGFGDLPALMGKNVAVTGLVKKFNDKPEIVLTNASQLKVVEPEKK
ncbi:MAG TPA: hypothetical protein VKV04_21275 [Verrucomicrobiae bacterium]|nr:hypothetical protein [Verrucomicrobiae bacterium]